MSTLKMRFGTTVTDITDTLTKHPLFSMNPGEYNQDILNMVKAYEQVGREVPKFTQDFHIYLFAHRSQQLATYLLTILDVLLAFDGQRTTQTLVFEYAYDLRTQGYDMQTHIEVHNTVTRHAETDENTGRMFSRAVSNRSAPRSIVVQPAPPPPPPVAEPQKRRMTLRRSGN
jgi:hypothetical protein